MWQFFYKNYKKFNIKIYLTKVKKNWLKIQLILKWFKKLKHLIKWKFAAIIGTGIGLKYFEAINNYKNSVLLVYEK